MKPIRERMRRTNSNYLFHDSREDVKTIMEYCNMLADKIDELNEEVQELKEKLRRSNGAI